MILGFSLGHSEPVVDCRGGLSAYKPEIDAQLLDRPFIAQTTNGAFVYSHINFRFDTATFEGITGEVALGDRFDPRRPPLMSFPVGSITDEKYGAFRLQTNWNVRAPLTAGAAPANVLPSDLQALVGVWCAGRWS